MKPHRIRMTHNLLLNYGLYRKMEIYRPHKATQEEMTKFHSDDYIRFLRSIRPDNMGEYNKQMQVTYESSNRKCLLPALHCRKVLISSINKCHNYFRDLILARIAQFLTVFTNFVNYLEAVQLLQL